MMPMFPAETVAAVCLAKRLPLLFSVSRLSARLKYCAALP
jgi:hypothetical protein